MNTPRRVWRAIGSAAALMIPFGRACAFCGIGHPDVRAEYRHSKSVFVGRVIAEAITPEAGHFYEGTTYAVLVKEPLKGRSPRVVNLFSENSSGRFPMQLGETYLLFVYDAVGRRSIDNCGNSGLVHERSPELTQSRLLRVTHGA